METIYCFVVEESKRTGAKSDYEECYPIGYPKAKPAADADADADADEGGGVSIAVIAVVVVVCLCAAGVAYVYFVIGFDNFKQQLAEERAEKAEQFAEEQGIEVL